MSFWQKIMQRNPLGRTTEHPKSFDAGLLFALPRTESRATLGIGADLPFIGYDEWTLYELCWLNNQGSPQVAMGLLKVPADSVCIVESKSLKLYANSLFYQRFSSPEALVNQVTADLNRLLSTSVSFQLMDLNQPFDYSQLADYQSLDNCIASPNQSADMSLLEARPVADTYRYQTNRFRSLCPVTGQPDWASIYIRMDRVAVEPEALAHYLLSFAEHQGFHENCVEQIFIELSNQLKPADLSVAARYTRRGGIDINPVRASSHRVLEMPGREVRQ